MLRSDTAIGLAILLACSFAACTGKSDAVNDTGAPSQPVAEPVAEPTAKPIAEPIIPFTRVEITPISATPHEVVWRNIEVQERIQLLDLDGGVLGKGLDTDQNYQLVDGRLEPFDFFPFDGVFGVWPDDAWSIAQRYDHALSSTRLLHLHDGKHWVAESYSGSDSTGGAYVFRKSMRPQGGLLATKNGVIERVAGIGPPPVIGSYRGELIEFIEAGEGKVYVISQQGQTREEGRTFHVVLDCADEACVLEKSRSLPLSGPWSFEHPVSRDAEALSLIASGEGREFVLDVGPAGWALSEFPDGNSLEGMWASEDGGLWVQDIGHGVLWRRDPQGTWRNVGLPEGIMGITVAMTADRKELWISGAASNLVSPLVFATNANT
jgi:hypothetical protein